MSKVVDLASVRHARASADSAGYKSGLNSCRETPDNRSTAMTRSGGTSSHCDTACAEMPSDSAKAVKPPVASIARLSASLGSSMTKNSSMALPGSQASLPCFAKAALYSFDMTLGNRIETARTRLNLTRPQVAEACEVTPQAVYRWEREGDRPEYERFPPLRRVLRVTYAWLMEGDGPPPAPNGPDVLLDDERGKGMTLLKPAPPARKRPLKQRLTRN